MSSPLGEKLSAFTPEKVPIPPALAQAPALAPLVADTPFPPSTRGNTSAPDIFLACTIMRDIVSQAQCGSHHGLCHIPHDFFQYTPLTAKFKCAAGIFFNYRKQRALIFSFRALILISLQLPRSRSPRRSPDRYSSSIA